MRVKKGQLRRWNQDTEVLGSRTFLTISSRIIRDRERDELGWGGRHRGEILWSILEDGILVDDVPQMTIHAHSEAIDETG